MYNPTVVLNFHILQKLHIIHNTVIHLLHWFSVNMTVWSGNLVCLHYHQKYIHISSYFTRIVLTVFDTLCSYSTVSMIYWILCYVTARVWEYFQGGIEKSIAMISWKHELLIFLLLLLLQWQLISIMCSCVYWEKWKINISAVASSAVVSK